MQNNIDKLKKFLKGKKVTLMGLGLLGRGLGDADFLAKYAKQLIVTDLKDEKELKESIKKLKHHKNIIFHLGGHLKDDFSNTDLVIKGNGVPLENKYIETAFKNNIKVFMSTAMFVSFLPKDVKTIGVTGTRGKTTITSIIYEILKKNIKKHNVFLGGNIRGMSTLALLPKIKSGDYVVLELDSWQLQGFGYQKISPNIAVFSNFMPDHLNYYSNMETYFKDKANIFKYQIKERGDLLFVGADIEEKIKKENPPIITYIPKKLSKNYNLNIKGIHNRENAALAKDVLRALKISDKNIKQGLENFSAVEGRLEFFGNFNGRKIYNDNNATTPEATAVGLESLGNNLILIAGGTDKKLELNKVIIEIKKRCKSVFLLEGSGTDKLVKKLNNFQVFSTFRETINAALENSKRGDTIIFSPIFSSFGKEFVNEYDRNDKFKKIIKQFYEKKS